MSRVTCSICGKWMEVDEEENEYYGTVCSDCSSDIEQWGEDWWDKTDDEW